MKPARYLASLAAAATAATAAAGAQGAPASRVPIRPLGAPTATSAERFGAVTAVRHLPGGRLLVNDPAGRRLLMFDSTLATATVVADSTPATGNAYAARISGLIAWRGDSTLFVDPTTLSMLVIDPAGKVARVMSVPRTQDAGALATGAAGFDAAGRMVYRAGLGRMMRGAPGAAPTPAPDTAPVVRIDMATRQLDTLGWVKTQSPRVSMSRDETTGRMSMSMTVNPMPVVDEWAVLSDGSVALVRGRDYHIDWVHADGSRTASAKIPFDWQRLSDEDKVTFIDSVKAVRDRMMAAGQGGGGMGAMIGMAGGAAGGAERITIMGGPGGPGPVPGGGAPGGAGPRPGGGGGMQFNTPDIGFIDPSELPDYRPPFFSGGVRADMDGNLWIRTTTPATTRGATVYDVVNRRGEIVDRVQVPAARQVQGFGPGGVVYLVGRDERGAFVERARTR